MASTGENKSSLRSFQSKQLLASCATRAIKRGILNYSDMTALCLLWQGSEADIGHSSAKLKKIIKNGIRNPNISLLVWVFLSEASLSCGNDMKPRPTKRCSWGALRKSKHLSSLSRCRHANKTAPVNCKRVCYWVAGRANPSKHAHCFHSLMKNMMQKQF